MPGAWRGSASSCAPGRCGGGYILIGRAYWRTRAHPDYLAMLGAEHGDRRPPRQRAGRHRRRARPHARRHARASTSGTSTSGSMPLDRALRARAARRPRRAGDARAHRASGAMPTCAGAATRSVSRRISSIGPAPGWGDVREGAGRTYTGGSCVEARCVVSLVLAAAILSMTASPWRRAGRAFSVRRRSRAVHPAARVSRARAPQRLARGHGRGPREPHGERAGLVRRRRQGRSRRPLRLRASLRAPDVQEHEVPRERAVRPPHRGRRRQQQREHARRRDQLLRGGAVESPRAPAVGRGRAHGQSRRERGQLQVGAHRRAGGVSPTRARRSPTDASSRRSRRARMPRIRTAAA